MTKYLVIFIFAIFQAFGANAQSAIGIKVGCNFANLSLKDSSGNSQIKNDIYPRIEYGLTLDIHVNSFISIDPELIMSKKGVQYSFKSFVSAGDSESVTAKIKLNYGELPVLGKIYYDWDLKAGKHKKKKGNRVFAVYALAGPYIGFCLRGKEYSPYQNTKIETDVLTAVNSWAYGLYYGGGISYKKNETTFFISGHKEWGWSNNNKYLWSPGSQVKHIGFSFAIGLMTEM